jgi:hypothetical protein
MNVVSMGLKMLDVTCLTHSLPFSTFNDKYFLSAYFFSLVRQRFPDCTVTGALENSLADINLVQKTLVDQMNCNFSCLSP